MIFREVAVFFSLTFISVMAETSALLFRPDQFKDMTETCRKSNGKPIRFILNEDNPAMYVSVDPAHPTLMALQRAERFKLFNKFTLDDKGRLLLQVYTFSESPIFCIAKKEIVIRCKCHHFD